MATATKIKFGDYLNVTDEGGGVIRVDGCPPGGGTGTTATGPVWCQAQNATNYVAADFHIGRSPNPLAYHYFSSTDDTAYAFDNTGVPGTNDGDVQILRSGLYLIRLSVAPTALTANANPGYNWDLALRAWGIDAGAGNHFGMDFAPGGAFTSGSAYAFFLSPRDNFDLITGYTAPNGCSLEGAGQAQAPETSVYLNLDDSAVTWPVNVNCEFRHGLNDANVALQSSMYSLLVIRLADSNPDAPTG